jgi:hypothetical protein
MKTRQIKLPGPDHPLSMQRNPARFALITGSRGDSSPKLNVNK